jgi:hypothetical protein
MSDDKPMQERVSILEIRMDNQDIKFEATQSLITKFFDKLDDHIVSETQHDAELQRGLVQVTTVVQGLTDTLSKTNEKLDSFSTMAIGTKDTVSSAQTAWFTVVKVVTVLAILISGAWAVYEFTVAHPNEVHVIKGKIS